MSLNREAVGKARLMLECSKCGKGDLIEFAYTTEGEVPEVVKCDACKALELVEYGARRAARHAVRDAGDEIPAGPTPLENMTPREVLYPGIPEAQPLFRRLRFSR